MNARASEQTADTKAPPIQRRNWVLGVGAAGAAVIAVKVLPAAAPLAPVAVAAKTAVDSSAGYQLTAHVQRYYDSTRA